MKSSASADITQALVSGLSGAVALTLVHQAARKLTPDAPRMDILGMRGLRKLLAAADAPAPDQQTLYNATMAGDLFSNGLYYSLVGSGKDAWWRGAVLGVAAGVGGVVLPGPLGLGDGPSNRTPQTQLMTVAWYTLGGLVAAGVSRWWSAAK
ncbi:hypothetical protein F0P96_14795 [Hymenobacter busanensis]|uniref:Uncharacterized protein n=1 Tax=Hymenobacter busanensis TaxID=2607656 RepID=A0A7L4ZYU0_9BACT|nr:hypothetical protein [Hymenobacter busanensis]KAA9331505.1 hypothetical protein F0P96_14795 [Hymenobacter busanensis]QHJ08659.1 hypothetical protein GUY19_15730 [Hymenobacter busanensis]